MNGPVEDLEERTDFLFDGATALEGRATALEGRATALEGRATALETVANVWYSGVLQTAPTNFFFSVGLPVGSSMALEVVVYHPVGGRVTTAHVLLGSDDTTQVEVIASVGDVLLPTADRSGGNIRIGVSGSFSAGELRATGRRLLHYTP